MKTGPGNMPGPSLWKCFIVLEVTFFLLLPGYALGSIALGVSPPFLEVQMGSGVNRRVAIEVTNAAGVAVTVRCFLADLTLSPQGEVLLLPEGSSPLSLSPCVVLQDARVFTLEPGERRKVFLRLKIPPDVREGRYGAVVFETVPEGSGEVAVSIRTGALLFLLPRIRKTERISVTVKRDDEGSLWLSLENAGNVHVRVRGEVLVRTREGKLLHRAVFPQNEKNLLILPGGVREITVEWEKRPFPPGEYEVEVRVFGEDRRRLRPLGALRVFLALP